MKVERIHRGLPLPQRVIAGSAKMIALFSLLALSLGTTYAASPQVFSDADLVRILALGVIVNGAALLLMLIRRVPWVVNVLLATVAVFGIASSHAIHTDLVFTNPPLLWLLLGAAGFALFVAFGAMDRSPSVGLAIVAVVSTVAGLFAANLFGRGEPSVELVDMSHMRDVTFERRPNVYFLSFDGIAPRILLRKYMDLETTPFHDLFEDRFRRFENFFAHAPWTNYSLDSVLALVPMRRRGTEGKSPGSHRSHLFSGHVESPLIRLFKFNGYETATAYESDFFGRTKGPFIDRYWNGGARALCSLLDQRVRAMSFWGYCLWFGHRRHLFDVRQELIDRFGGAAFRDGPQFAMAHVWTPGHADKPFHYSDEDHRREFRAGYLRGSVDAAWFLQRLLAHLDENDPQAILLVYGDHGPMLSLNVAFADTPEFVVHDRYGVLGGVYPPGACEREFDKAQEKRPYLTVLDAVHAVLRCLSGGKSALRTDPADYWLDGWPELVPDGHLRTYAEFLYE